MGDRNGKHRNGTKFKEVPSGSIGKMEAGIGSNGDLAISGSNLDDRSNQDYMTSKEENILVDTLQIVKEQE